MKPGDKLKVKMGLEHNKKYGENCYRNGMFKGGEIVTLKEYKEDGGWCVKEDSRWRYTPEMLEPISKNSLKKGDKLKVKKSLCYSKKYGKSVYNECMFEGGAIVTLKEYHTEFDSWLVEEDEWYYAPEMLEPLNKNYLHEAVKSFMADHKLEIGKEFKIKEAAEECLYFINDKYILQYRNRQATGISVNEIQELLTGELEIIETPWKPTSEYFYNSPVGTYLADVENLTLAALFNFEQKNYYKTKAEAEADRPRMLKIFDEIQDEFNKL